MGVFFLEVGLTRRQRVYTSHIEQSVGRVCEILEVVFFGKKGWRF